MNETNISPKQQTKKEDARISCADEHPRGASGSETTASKGPQTAHGKHPAEAAEVVGSPSRSQRFPRAFRLRKRREFFAVQRSGMRQTAPHFVVITRSKKNSPSRIGITTSKKVGIAPARNRVRRMVREFFRRHRAFLVKSCDIVVIARPGAAELPYSKVVDELSKLLPSDPTHPMEG